MKRLLLLLITTLLVFTLAACQDDTIQDSIDTLETSVATLDTSIADVLADIASIETAISDLETDSAGNITDLAALDVLIAALQAKTDLLDVLVDSIINPEQDIFYEKVTEIVIAHTNDVHGRVNDDSWAGTIGMATVKNVLDKLDEQYENTFFVSAGDIFHGTTFATLEEGESVLNVMNMMGYDLMVPGNHDFNYGQDRLLELEELADFPMITANIQYDADDTDYMDPYFIQEFDGVTIGFFGLTSPETVYKTHPDNVIGLNFLDPIAQAAIMVAELEPLVDIIILLAHIGLDESTLVTTEDIAYAVPGIDVIIDGHSHSVLPEGMMVDDTLIVSAGEYLKNLGAFKLTVQNGEIIDINVTLIDAEMMATLDYGFDQDIQDYIDDIVAAQDIILGEVVGQTAVELLGERDDVRTGETNLGNLITDSMLIVTGADVAITNGGGIRASILAGDVTLGDIITVLPFGNIVVTKNLTGAQILATLEFATGFYPSSSGGFPHVAGMTFEINCNNPAGYRVENLMIGGVAVVLENVYSVATNDFLAAGGDGYELFAATPITAEFMGLHEGLTDMFTVGVDIDMPVMGRIVVTNPEYANSDIFFSEYIEGSSNNKAIEIYNPFGLAVDLTGYVINYYNNGSATVTRFFDLTGIILDAGEVYVICTDSYTGPAICDETQAYADADSVVFFNGNDAMELMKDGVAIDVIGEVGVDEYWVVGTGATSEYTLVRDPGIYAPNGVFTPGEWVVYPQDTFDYLGAHTVD